MYSILSLTIELKSVLTITQPESKRKNHFNIQCFLKPGCNGHLWERGWDPPKAQRILPIFIQLIYYMHSPATLLGSPCSYITVNDCLLQNVNAIQMFYGHLAGWEVNWAGCAIRHAILHTLVVTSAGLTFCCASIFSKQQSAQSDLRLQQGSFLHTAVSLWMFSLCGPVLL